ncbi:hypothetical protein C8J57DRAFT_1485004 [Mycena rebaudengoi]|nr:hypothetical protein C8J57DRAFT_1485004 [Mycena rebaudengoi]
MPPRRVDLKQVGKLFKDTLAEIRDVAQDFDTLEPQAIAWLRGARLKVMRRIESSYYELERSRNDLRVPDWVDPSRCLYISTDRVEMPLRPYAPAFCANLSALLSSCDFPSFSAVFCNVFYVITITISFPAQQRLTAHPHGAPAQTLHVDDEFSGMAGGAPQEDRKPSVGAFSATNFARLLADARGEGSASPGNTPGASNKRHRASRTVKDESDDENPRLRSVTRPSSSATLRSRSSAPRRSSRKKAKTET